MALSDEVELADVTGALLMTAAVMLTVGLFACIEPATRALRIHPIDALKERLTRSRLRAELLSRQTLR